MNEQINVSGEGKEDKLMSIAETSSEVILTIVSRGKTLTVHIPMTHINFTKDFINRMAIGEKYKSTELYESYIDKFNLKSKIMIQKLRTIRLTMEDLGFDQIRISYLLEALENNKDFCLMNYTEFLGERNVETSNYFKLWGSLRFFKEKGLISYNIRGGMYRLI